jgi:hypothetical protein
MWDIYTQLTRACKLKPYENRDGRDSDHIQFRGSLEKLKLKGPEGRPTCHALLFLADQSQDVS